MKHLTLAAFLLAGLAACNQPASTTESDTHISTDTAVISPAPAPSTAGMDTTNMIHGTATASNGDVLHMNFDTARSKVFLDLRGEKIELDQQVSGSGVRYTNPNYEYIEWHGQITLTKDGAIVFENAAAEADRKNRK